MRRITGLALVLAVMGVTGCQQGAAPTAQEGTSAAAVQVPEGWQVRVDRSQSAVDPDDTPDLKFTTMGNGFRVTGGPAGVFWSPANTATGNYTVKGNFTLQQPSSHTNYYGLIFGGRDLEGAGQNYTYFLVAQDGTYLIKHRAGEEVLDVKSGTPHDAIRKPDASGKSINALEVRVSGNDISYVVNGTVVATTPKTGVTASTDGLTGFRVNHVLDVSVDGFEVTGS
jgi:hypothetical protein